jgi:phage FluMu protein Com
MDPRDDQSSLAGGVDCAACGSFVPTDRIRVLARRDDIAFVEIDCPACRSESLGIVIAPESAHGGSAAGPYGEFGPPDEERFREALPIGHDDIQLVHDLLIRKGLAALVSRSEPPSGLGR